MTYSKKLHKAAELRLALLKENFNFLDFYEQLIANPDEICPELRHAEEDYQTYQKRIDWMNIHATPFFGGLADQVPHSINRMFLHETQIAKIEVDDVLKLLSPTKVPSDVRSSKLRDMLPRLFHQNAVAECELEIAKHQHLPNDNTLSIAEWRRFLHEQTIQEWKVISNPYSPRQPINKFGPEVPPKYRPKSNVRLQPFELLLKIDLRQPRAEIIEQFTSLLDRTYEKQRDDRRLEKRVQNDWENNHVGIYPYKISKPWDPFNRRNRDETYQQLEVWRLRKEKLTFAEIAEKLERDVAWAKKSFYRIYEKIQGEQYQPDDIKKIRETRKNQLDIYCEICPAHKDCVEPCPEVTKYIEQDRKKYSREILFDDETLIFLQNKLHYSP